VQNDPQSWKDVLGPDGAAKIKQETAKYYKRHARLGDRILTNFVQFLRAY
jgi:hypothetical protein